MHQTPWMRTISSTSTRLRRGFLAGLCLCFFTAVVAACQQAPASGNAPAETRGKAGQTTQAKADCEKVDKGEILVGSDLEEGYDMGVNSSGGKIEWVKYTRDYQIMAFPANQKWAAVFITVGESKDPPRPCRDFSAFSTLSIEMRGERGGEQVDIGIKTNEQPDNGKETKMPIKLTPSWETYRFPLADFRRAELNHLYVVTEFVYTGTAAQTVYFKNIKYSR